MAYAEEYVVIVASTNDPSCADTDTCLIPSEIYIKPGDSVRFEWESYKSGLHYMQAGSAETGVSKNAPTPEGPYHEEGYYPYFIMINPWIHGAVIVTDGEFDQTKEIEEKSQEHEIIDQEIEEEKLQIKLDQANDRILELDKKNDELQETILDLKFENRELKLKIDNLNAIIMEQVKVIMTWIEGN